MIMHALDPGSSTDGDPASTSGESAGVSSQPAVAIPDSVAARLISSSNNSSGAVFYAKRYAVKFSPPCVFLEYEDAKGKRRVRAVKLNSVQPDVDIDKLTRKVIRSFPRKLDVASVKYDQVRKLVARLAEHAAKEAAGAVSSNAGSGSASAVRGEGARPAPLTVVGDTSTRQPGASGSQAPQQGNTSSSNGGPPLLPSVSPKLSGSHAHPLAKLLGGAGFERGAVADSTDSRFSTSTTSLPDKRPSGGELDIDAAMGDLDRELGDSPPFAQGQGHAITSASVFASGAAQAATLAHSRPGSSGAQPAGASTADELGMSSPGLLSRDGSFCVADRALASAGNSSSTLPGHLGLSSSVGAALSDLGSRGAGSAASSKGAAGEGGGLVTVASAPGPSSGSTGSKHAPGTTSGKSRFAQEAESLVLELEVGDDVDLNKVTEMELHLAKMRMDQDFQKNRVLPGDPRYEYDKQVEFGPATEHNDWDDDEDDAD